MPFQNLTTRDGGFIAQCAGLLARRYESMRCAEGHEMLLWVSQGCGEYGEPDITVKHLTWGPDGKTQVNAEMGVTLLTGPLGLDVAIYRTEPAPASEDAQAIVGEFIRRLLDLANEIAGRIQEEANQM